MRSSTLADSPAVTLIRTSWTRAAAQQLCRDTGKDVQDRNGSVWGYFPQLTGFVARVLDTRGEVA